MYEKPNIPDDDLRAVLREQYGIEAVRWPFCRWALTAWLVCTGW